jgi:DNA-binding winged helix-turn-helix (wHTH) protein
MFQTMPHSGRLRIGTCDVDVMRRVVTSREDRRVNRLTVKAQQVLLALVEARGMVVSRSVLLSQVWPETMPTDDVLTQAVTQLRKAFGDDRAAPRYIETITKGGYRLLADFEWQDATVELGEEGDDRPSDITAQFDQAWRSQRTALAAADTPFDAALLLLLWTVVRRDGAGRSPESDAAPEERPATRSAQLSYLA